MHNNKCDVIILMQKKTKLRIVGLVMGPQGQVLIFSAYIRKWETYGMRIFLLMKVCTYTIYFCGCVHLLLTVYIARTSEATREGTYVLCLYTYVYSMHPLLVVLLFTIQYTVWVVIFMDFVGQSQTTKINL